MPATTTPDTTPALGDLVISQFDQWNATSDPAFSPTTICWCGDPAVDSE